MLRGIKYSCFSRKTRSSPVSLQMHASRSWTRWNRPLQQRPKDPSCCRVASSCSQTMYALGFHLTTLHLSIVTSTSHTKRLPYKHKLPAARPSRCWKVASPQDLRNQAEYACTMNVCFTMNHHFLLAMCEQSFVDLEPSHLKHAKPSFSKFTNILHNHDCPTDVSKALASGMAVVSRMVPSTCGELLCRGLHELHGCMSLRLRLPPFISQSKLSN